MTKCPRCFVNDLSDNPALDAMSHDGKTQICSQCGMIESLETLDPMRAHYLKVGLRRAQAALYGLDENGNPRLPKITKRMQKRLGKGWRAVVEQSKRRRFLSD